MVDAVKGLGVAVNIITGKTPVENIKRDDVQKQEKVTEDKVEISVRALSLQEAERTSRETSTQLKSADYSLGLNPSFISENAG